MAKRQNYILGLGPAALAAGSVAPFPVIADHGNDRLAFYATAVKNEQYRRQLNPGWTNGPSARRAFQFFTRGLSWLTKPNPAGLEFIRRHTSIVKVARRTDRLATINTHGGLELGDCHYEDNCYFLAQPARLAQHLEASCRVLNDVPIAINLSSRTIEFKRHALPFEHIISALPLSDVTILTNLKVWRQPYVQVLNLSYRAPVKGWIHAERVLIEGTGRFHLVDEIGFYANVAGDYAPVESTCNHFAISVRHNVRDVAELLGQAAFKANVITELMYYGFDVTHNECCEYNLVRENQATMGGPSRTELLESLAQSGVYQVGSLGRAVEQSLDLDILEGLSTGAALV